MTLSSTLVRTAAFAAALAATGAVLTAQCGINPNYGTNLGLTDDSVSPAQALGFTFSFAGANYDSVIVSSNGFLYLWDSAGAIPLPTANLCCNGAVATMLASASPMVAGLWQDLNPSAGGSVNFNATAGQAIITWDLVPEFGSTGSANTFQITLNASGNIGFMFAGNCLNAAHTALTGMSPGAGAADPGGSNLSAASTATASATVYELFNANAFDLAGSGRDALATSASSWLIVPPTGCARVDLFGRGCPESADFYELFAGSAFDLSGGSLLFSAAGNGSYSVTTCTTNCFDANFTTNLGLTDDSLAVGQALGFTFPFAGGSTTAIDVCSNGFVWLVSGASTSADFSPSTAEFMSNPARLAPLWMDLNPTAGGTVHFDALPGKALVTWNGVFAYGTTNPNTMQLQLFPNGDFILAWPSALNNATTTAGAAICGLAQGAGSSDPGSRDLSAVPFGTGVLGSIPLALAAQTGSRPVIGQNFTMEASNVRPGSVSAALNLGFTVPNLNLGIVGLPACTLLSSVDLAFGLVAVSPVTSVTFGIPNDPTIVGVPLNAQAVMVDLSLGGAIPAYLSNGLRMTFGL